MDKTEARQIILKAANKDMASIALNPYTVKHLDRAVQKLRNKNKIEGNDALAAALFTLGYNICGPNWRPVKVQA